MNFSESLVQEVLAVARIPDAAARRDIAEELRAHLDDLSAQAIEHGHNGDRAEVFIRENFGSPSVVGRGFAQVYRFERIRLYALVGSSIGTILTLLATLVVYGVQRWLAAKLGLESTLSARHFSREAIVIAVAVGAYTTVALIRWAAPLKRTLVAWGTITLGLLGLAVCLFPDASRGIGLGLIFALSMCAAESFFRAWASRIGANWLVASLAGFLLATFMMADVSRPMLFVVPMWLVIALAISAAASTAGALGSRILTRRFAG